MKIKGDTINDGHEWQELNQERKGEGDVEIIYGIKMKRTIFTAREGHASCVLPLDKIIGTSSQSDNVIIATFGGRASPARPKDELIMMSSKSHPLQFFNAIDVRGECPPARWRHSFIYSQVLMERLR